MKLKRRKIYKKKVKVGKSGTLKKVRGHGVEVVGMGFHGGGPGLTMSRGK